MVCLLDNEDELRRLESEDVQSSMHEAAEFMDLLNRNQQVTGGDRERGAALARSAI